MVGARQINQAISLEFFLGKKAKKDRDSMILAKYLYAQRTGIIIPATDRDIDVLFPPMSSTYQDSKMVVTLHNVRCEDSYYPSFCRLNVVIGGKQTDITANGAIGVIPIPTKANLTTSEYDQYFVEREENESVTLTCTANATGGLPVHWMKTFPFFNTIHSIVKEDKQAWQGQGVRHPVCNKTLIYPYFSQITVKFTASEDFSEYYCTIFDNRVKDITMSEKLSFFVKPKSVPATSEGILMPELHPLNKAVMNNQNTSVWYEGLKARLYCNHSIANIPKADVGKTIRLRLSFILAQPGGPSSVEQEIVTMYPYVPVYDELSNSSVHPDSSFKLLGINGSTEDDVSDATIRWSINWADCVGSGTYKCTVWYAGDHYKSPAVHSLVQSSYQNIDFQCGVHLVKMLAYTQNGTLITEAKAEPAQHLIISCHILGPKSITWNITGNGYSIYEGNSTVETGVKGIPHRQKYPGCLCFPHKYNFMVQVPVLHSHGKHDVATCEVSIQGMGAQSMSFVIEKHKKEFRPPHSHLLDSLAIAIMAISASVVICQVVLSFCKQEPTLCCGRNAADDVAPSEPGSSSAKSSKSRSSSAGSKRSSSGSIVSRVMRGAEGLYNRRWSDSSTYPYTETYVGSDV